jgi:hypothetical protein
MQNLRFLPLITALTALTLTSCSTATTEEYEATALTSYTWQVKTIQNSKLLIPKGFIGGLKQRCCPFLYLH